MQKMMRFLTVKLLAVALTALSLVACTGGGNFTLTRHYAHELVQSDLNELHAKVYFIRPHTEHAQGFADNDLTVDVDGQRLLALSKGEYALVHLRPRAVNITMRNLTQTRGRWEVEELKRSHQFDFKPGETYFILADNVDGEFRGVYFVPKSIPLHEARAAAEHARASGAARHAPISRL